MPHQRTCHVPYAGEFDEPRHYDVVGEVDDTVALRDRVYSLNLLGPNGFRREFSGATDSAAASLDVSTTVDAGTRTLVLTATNSGSRALTVNVDGNRRKLAAGAHSQWTVRSVDGWYQAAVTVDEDPEFKRVLVGHIENGRTSVSQPT